ncbi:hypothetical protein NMY22_g10711 [Coprinellus aureogranulatus]|nr:hypothetical protein NMY22_g10711 [Coprinellus aureogranulatus]
MPRLKSPANYAGLAQAISDGTREIYLHKFFRVWFYEHPVPRRPTMLDVTYERIVEERKQVVEKEIMKRLEIWRYQRSRGLATQHTDGSDIPTSVTPQLEEETEQIQEIDRFEVDEYNQVSTQFWDSEPTHAPFNFATSANSPTHPPIHYGNAEWIPAPVDVENAELTQAPTQFSASEPINPTNFSPFEATDSTHTSLAVPMSMIEGPHCQYRHSTASVPIATDTQPITVQSSNVQFDDGVCRIKLANTNVFAFLLKLAVDVDNEAEAQHRASGCKKCYGDEAGRKL